MRVPAGDIELLVRTRLAIWFADRNAVVSGLPADGDPQLSKLLQMCGDRATQMESASSGELREMLLLAGASVRLRSEVVALSFSIHRLLGLGSDADHATEVTITSAAKLVRKRMELRISYPNDGSGCTDPARPEAARSAREGRACLDRALLRRRGGEVEA
ncbi:MAG: hypothetical protein JOY99_16470 [Sphingomonadaceae bacterium]|nr:hypothetical protein [Sphingomonadaceae bacterium]